MKSKITPNIFKSILLLWTVYPVYATDPEGLQADTNTKYIRLIHAYYEEGHWERGLMTLEEALKEFPKDSDLRMLLGRYHFEQGNYDMARYELQKALDYNPFNVNAKQILVNVEMDSGRYSSAICYINELLEVNPYWKGLWFKKMEAYKMQGNYIEADRLLIRLHKIYPDDEDIRATYIYSREQTIAEKMNNGELNEAIKIGSALIEINPQNHTLYLELINNCLKAGDHTSALMYTERGLYNIPYNRALMDKKVDILGEQHRYTEALDFLQSCITTSSDKALLQRRYDLMREEAARHSRQNDAYALNKKVYLKNPRNEGAFEYVMGIALANNYHEDALEFIRVGKNIKGNTKDLLLKEYAVYLDMGAISKSEQILMQLYREYPDDNNIKYQYTLYRIRQGKAYMNQELYSSALEHWYFVANTGGPEDSKTALSSIHNCCYKLGDHTGSLTALDRLIAAYPEELDWRAKKAGVYMEMGRYLDAVIEYGEVVSLSIPEEKKLALRGYDEVATVCTKRLIESYRIMEARELVGRWLEVNSKSELGLLYAMNLSMRTGNYEEVKKYARIEIEREPGDINHLIKLAQAHHNLGELQEAENVLAPLVQANPYHKELVETYTQVCIDYGRMLLENGDYEKSMEVLDDALRYDPNEIILKYWKGIVYEKIHDYQEAYHYQSFYQPSAMELVTFRNHIKDLKYKSHGNEVGFNYLHSRLSDEDIISYIGTVEYSRFRVKNSYAGRVNYTGRPTGKGIQGQFEWSRKWKRGGYSRIDVAAANKFFPYFMLNGAVYKEFYGTWEGGIGAGYRRTFDKQNLFNIKVGVSKELHLWWLDARLNSVIMGGKFLYNIFCQSRYYFNENGSYFVAMASFGSAPDINVIDKQLYDGFSVTNSMIGLGASHLITDKVSVGLLGNWYHYKDTNYVPEDSGSKYRNMYNVYLQLHVRF